MKFSLIISDGSHPCSTAPLQGPAEVCFEKAAKLQVQGVQLTLDSPARYPLELIQSLMEKTGLAVSALRQERFTQDGDAVSGAEMKNAAESRGKPAGTAFLRERTWRALAHHRCRSGAFVRCPKRAPLLSSI